MGRAVAIAISEIHACALRARLSRSLDRAIAARLAAARAVLEDDHPLAGAVDYFLVICARDPESVERQALRLRESVLDCLRPVRHNDLGKIYG